MVVIHGTRPFGKCDNVPELFYVATWFFHIDYFPLFPTGTRLVLGQSGKQYQVINLPISFKSILLAWIRAAGFLGSIIAWVIFAVALNDRQMMRDGDWQPALIFAVACTLALVLALVPKYRKPSYKRACELAQIACLSDTGWAALNVQYGRDPMDRPNKVEMLNVR